MSGVVVIGIGNPYRADDDIGPALADLIADMALRHVTVVVDAVLRTSPDPGRIHRTALDEISHFESATSSHGMGVPEAVLLGGALGLLPRRLVVFAAPTGHRRADRDPEVRRWSMRGLPALLTRLRPSHHRVVPVLRPEEVDTVTAKPCTSPVVEGLPADNSPTAVLVDARTGGHPDEGYDRVVFDFRDDTSMPGFSVGYVDQVIQDPSDRPLPMLPGAKLQVDIRWATAHDDTNTDAGTTGESTIPDDWDLRPGLSRVKQVKLAGDFEGHLRFGIAVFPVGDPAPFRVQTVSGARLVVDVAHAGRSPWYCGQVHFADEQKITAGITPPVTAVERRLSKPAVAAAALDEMFDGPERPERERGLMFVSSHATGYADLRISPDKVAHVRLLGPISSDGSAVITIADQIIPTLRQFPTVDWVKVYDEDGKTGRPDGPTDSIPEQLEP